MSWINSKNPNPTKECPICHEQTEGFVCFGCYRKLRAFEKRLMNAKKLHVHEFWDDEYREMLLELYLIEEKEKVQFT